MSEHSTSDTERFDLDRNEYQAGCESCGEKRVARVDSTHSVSTVELAEKQRLWCGNCESDRTHTVIVAGGSHHV